MGKPSVSETDMASVVTTGTFAATGTSPWQVIRAGYGFNVSLSGTFVATVALEKSYDGGTTAIPVSRDALGTAATFTAPCSLLMQEVEPGCVFRWNCSSWTSGAVNYRISQA